MITTAVCATVMIGMLGLALDLGRMYIVRNELQAFTDSSAMAATYELDGTQAGIDNAKATALSGPGSTPNRWNFGTTNLVASQVSTAFASTYNGAGGWETNPANPASISFVRVGATADVPVYALQILGVGSSQRMRATSFAGFARTPVGKNSDPFSPDAINPADPNFGFIPDDPGDNQPPLLYSFKWVPPGQRTCSMDESQGGSTGNGNGNGSGNGGNSQVCETASANDRVQLDNLAAQNKYCSGDYLARYEPPSGSGNPQDDRGLIDVGQGSGTSGLIETIVNRNWDTVDAPSLTIGSQLDIVGGDRGINVPEAINTRISQDTDQGNVPFSQYTGNGRRLLQVPVNNPADDRIIGYATFFMPPNACGTTPGEPCCAQFVKATFTIGSKEAPVGGSSNGQNFVYTVRLFNGGY